MWTKNFQMYKLDLEMAEEPEPTSLDHKKTREFQKNFYFCFIDYTEAFNRVYHNELWKILKEMGIAAPLPDSWETCMQVKRQQLKLDMEKWNGCVLSPCLFNSYAEYIMWNARLDEAQAGTKTANLRYTDNTT